MTPTNPTPTGASELTRERVRLKLEGAKLLLADGQMHATSYVPFVAALCEHYLSIPAIAPAPTVLSELKDKLITDSLGFQLTVKIEVGAYDFRGSHSAYEDYDTKKVASDAEHVIRVQAGMGAEELAEVVSHECHHLFYSIRHLITVDEETEAEVFGQLVKRIFTLANRAAPDESLTIPVSLENASPEPAVPKSRCSKCESNW